MSDRVSAYPLADALLNRRSRRFAKAMRLSGGPLAYASRRGGDRYARVRLSPLRPALEAGANRIVEWHSDLRSLPPQSLMYWSSGRA